MMLHHQPLKPLNGEEQALYDHFICLVDQELPQETINRFRLLFVEGVGYPDLRIKGALERLVLDRAADQNFRFILNRCCHILINRWRQQATSKSAIVKLVDTIAQSPSRPATELSRTSTVRHLRYLIQSFIQSDHYQMLKRLAQVAGQGGVEDADQEEPLGATIHRYPYLYSHCLLDDESSYEQQELVKQFQAEAQKKFEQDLSQYITYQRQYQQLSQLGRHDLASRVVTTPQNPTLLPEAEFKKALQQFVGPVDQSRTCQDLAKDFLTQAQTHKTYANFKSDLYSYLTSAVDPSYGQRNFNRNLGQFLQSLNAKCDAQAMSEFLVVRTMSQLMNFLVIESPQKPQHFLFLDLINNIGPTTTTSLLLRIVLTCKKVKPYLEKRFAILFGHYEKHTKDSLRWMVKVLENVNLALVTNFGRTNFSHLLFQ